MNDLKNDTNYKYRLKKRIIFHCIFIQDRYQSHQEDHLSFSLFDRIHWSWDIRHHLYLPLQSFHKVLHRLFLHLYKYKLGWELMKEVFLPISDAIFLRVWNDMRPYLSSSKRLKILSISSLESLELFWIKWIHFMKR